MQTVKSFSASLVTKGVQAITNAVTASESQLVFFMGLKRVGVDTANVKDYKDQFGRVVMAYLDTKYKVKGKVKVTVAKWLADNAQLKGASISPFLKGKGKQAGKPYTKRELESLIRGMANFWADNYTKYLNGTKRGGETNTQKPTFVKDIEAAWPRMAALQKLETPTSAEVAAIKLWKAVVDHAIASCPEALKIHNKKLANALKASKK